jgi:nucleotide-binding universal stress UspA family protein
MYKKILVTLDASPTDRAIIEHIKQLAKEMGSSVVLFHVATGVPAQFHGPDAGGKEVDEDSAYLAKVEAEFRSAGVPAKAELAFGDPFTEIVKWVEEQGCDLVAMGTHGHGLLADVFFGTTANRVQHNISIPVLLLRAR